jgi:hypothetical protein
MKHIVFIFITFVFYKSILGQNIAYQNSCDTNCKFFQGRLTDKILDSGTYVYAVSKHYSFIEFTSFRKGIMMVKYRVEKLSNPHVFIITKTYSRDSDSTATYFLAIDSNMFNNIKMKKQYSKDLNNKNICLELSLVDSIIVSLFSKFIIEHKLETEYLYFKPRSFVAWLKIKI